MIRHAVFFLPLLLGACVSPGEAAYRADRDAAIARYEARKVAREERERTAQAPSPVRCEAMCQEFAYNQAVRDVLTQPTVVYVTPYYYNPIYPRRY